ncbi:MAG: NTP transferase domain-containing protein [Phycisphaera sp.]|nr:MAG: NTP transferase domain-containing protein [Phycisphaera sp.]
MNDTLPQSDPRPCAIILAAGKGTRMGSDLPKVVHPVGGRPMVSIVAEACHAVGCTPIVAVVGHGREHVERALVDASGDIRYALQAEQLGTGHAVLAAESELNDASPDSDVLVLCGDGPLIRDDTIRTLLDTHRKANAAATLATAAVDDPTGYGRVVRDAKGRFARIVEQKNATADELAIREINPSYYCFKLGPLMDALRNVERNPKTGEYYLTDVPALLLAGGARVEVVEAVPAEDVLSINTPEQLAVVDRIYRQRQNAAQGARA